MELNKEIINIPNYIKEVEEMDVFDKLLIWNHANVNNLYHRTKLRFLGEKDYWNVSLKWEDFKNERYAVVDIGKDWEIHNYAQRYLVGEAEIHRWYHLFKKEIFNGRKI